MVGIIGVVIAQWVTSAFTRTVLARREAAKRGQSRSPDAVPKPRALGLSSRAASLVMTRQTAARMTVRTRPVTARETAAQRVARRAVLRSSREASYRTLLDSGDLLPVASAHWLSDQAVVCSNGHRSNFGLFATLPGYGPFSHLPEVPDRGLRRLAAALRERRGTAGHPINDRDPRHDGRWEMACPACGTDRYTFVSEKLREYAMCTASPDLFWLPCHLHRRRSGECPNCVLRGVYWDGLRDLE